MCFALMRNAVSDAGWAVFKQQGLGIGDLSQEPKKRWVQRVLSA
jgi:hypothetical protein